MEKLNYQELIDPFCIPVIKILREDLGVDTMFCCQGKSGPGDPHHSSRGYIACRITPKSKKIILDLVDLLNQRTDLPRGICNIEFLYNSKRSPKGNDFIVLRLRKLEEVSYVWSIMEEILRTQP